MSGKLFLFFDETGDPGHPDKRDASRYYQVNIVSASRDQIGFISQEFSRFRYFIKADRELEKYVPYQKKILQDLCMILSQKGVKFFSFCLNKEKYIGPYLKNIGREKFNYDSKKFRNFVIKKATEKFFICNPVQEGQEIELIFDRFLDNEEEEKELKNYLRGNYKLPPFLHIVQVDSVYSDVIQVTDIFGTLVKSCVFDEKYSLEKISFAKIFEVEDPDHIKEKSPDTY